MKPNVLYYPYFLPNSDEWLASSLLWWEKLYLIWPDGIQAHNPVIQDLIEADLIGTVNPSNAVEHYIDEYVNDILTPNLDSLVKNPPSFSQSIYLHSNKVRPLIKFLDSNITKIGKRYQVSANEFKLDKDIEVPYMSFLADKISKDLHNRWPPTTSDVVTDDDFYLRYSGNIRPIPQGDTEQIRSEADQAVLVTFKDIVLEFEEFTSKQIKDFIDFRIECKTQRENFRTTVAQTIATLKLTSQLKENDQRDLVTDTSQKLKDELKKLEKQLQRKNFRTKLTDLGAVLGGVLSIPGGLGAAIGVTVVGIATSEAIAKHEIGDTLEQSPFTYLYKVKQKFGRKKWFSDKNNRSK